MIKSVFSIAAGIAAMAACLSGCSDNGNTPEPVTDEEKTGTIAFTIDFARAGSSRASGEGTGSPTTGSEPIHQSISYSRPTTSWDNIHSLQLFLYDANNVIHFTKYVDANEIKATLEANPSLNGKITYTYANVPIGTYFLVAVANANSSQERLTSYIDGLSTTWNEENVLNRYMHRLRLEHKPSAFPSFYLSHIQQSGITRDEKPFAEPAELFMGVGHEAGKTDKHVQVIYEHETRVEVDLKRQNALMRLRLNLAGDGEDLNNADVSFNENGMVNFSQNASVMLATLPKEFVPVHDDYVADDGTKIIAGISEECIMGNVMVCEGSAGNSSRQFIDGNPTEGYESTQTWTPEGDPGKIVDIDGDPFKATSWRDIVVMPNDKVRQLNGSNAIKNENRYLLIISALGLPGHVTKEGVLEEARTVYWTGYINEPLSANTIREVNVVFKDGGSQELPVRPDDSGSLIVTVKDPVDWQFKTTIKVEL